MRLPRYEIRIHGRFSRRWHGVFQPFEIAAERDDVTVLRGAVPDQAGLHGVLRRFEEYGVSLISLDRLDYDTA